MVIKELIGTKISVLRDQLDKIESYLPLSLLNVEGRQLTVANGVMLDDALEQSKLDMEGSLDLLGR